MKNMRLGTAARRFGIGAVMIGSLTALLLYSDRGHRPARAPSSTPTKMYRIGIAYFAPEEGNDLCIQGLLAGLRSEGFVEGKNLEVLKSHAQAEIGNIPAMMQNFDSQGLDLIVPMSTPCLTAACNVVKKTPITFVYVYDPIAAGAGKSWTDHRPNVTGVGSFPEIGETFEVIQELVPGVRAVGTLYNSSEANSRKAMSVGREACARRGLKLEEIAITSTSEVFQAAQVLATRDIQALWITGDNTALQAFSGIAKVAADHRLPMIINDPEFVDKGALAAIGIGWYKSGFEAGKMASRVLRGASPASIPMVNVVDKKLVLNEAVARKLGISFPASLTAKARP
jgi:putative ABC transport system substrate-binding protein